MHGADFIVQNKNSLQQEKNKSNLLSFDSIIQVGLNNDENLMIDNELFLCYISHKNVFKMEHSLKPRSQSIHWRGMDGMEEIQITLMNRSAYNENGNSTWIFHFHCTREMEWMEWKFH